MKRRKNQKDNESFRGESGVSQSTPKAKDDSIVNPSLEFNPYQRQRKEGRKTVCIVVLGDIGRSPRMRYHAESFAKEDFLVTMIGYGGSLPQEIEDNPLISTVTMSEAPKVLQKVPRLLAYPLKMSWLLVSLTFAFLWMVIRHQFRPDFILVQNPPAIPTLACCWAYSKIFASDLIIDWHNYGYSIMGMSMKKEHPMLRFATWFEMYFGSKADHHLCVTKGMAEDLNKRIGIKPVVLYDRPPNIFQSLTETEKAEFLGKFCKEYYPELGTLLCSSNGKDKTCGILVSSTSWTEDEDFGILLEGLVYYEAVKDKHPDKYPDLLVFITGKGPLKEYYKEKIKEVGLKNVQIYLPWLEHGHYPKLLGCADLGISLHTSSSGLDLPMKVVDMFGCGLPVCAVGFPCVGELVVHGKNGWVFKNSKELGEQIVSWFEGFDSGKRKPECKLFRQEIKKFQALRWHQNWTKNVIGLLK